MRPGRLTFSPSPVCTRAAAQLPRSRQSRKGSWAGTEYGGTVERGGGMQNPSRMACLVLTVSLAATMLALPARADMALPAWTPGDRWAYSVTQTAPNQVTGSVRMDVVGTEAVTVQGVPYTGYRLQVDSRLVQAGGS